MSYVMPEKKREEMMDWVLVPVNWDDLGAVRALLDQRDSKGSAAGPTVEPESAGSGEKWPEEKLRLIYEDCKPTVQRILWELAQHEDEEWVYGTELMQAAAEEGRSKNIGHYLKSLTKAIERHHHDPREWPIELEQDERTRLYKYRMLRSVAKIVRGFPRPS